MKFMKPVWLAKAMLPTLLHRRMSRTRFLRSLGRYVLLGVVVLAAAWLISRRSKPAGGGCKIDLSCSQCAELPGCEWARAAETRRELRSKS